MDGALLDFAPRDLKDLAEDGGGPKALPGGQELDQVVCQERWFLSGGHAGTVCMLGAGVSGEKIWRVHLFPFRLFCQYHPLVSEGILMKTV